MVLDTDLCTGQNKRKGRGKFRISNMFFVPGLDHFEKRGLLRLERGFKKRTRAAPVNQGWNKVD